MVTAPMMHQGLDVDLPSAKSTGLPVPDDPFILTIKKDGKGVYRKSRNSLCSQLTSKLTHIFKVKKDKQIYIQADKKAYYQAVAETMGEIRSAGLTQISLITQFKE